MVPSTINDPQFQVFSKQLVKTQIKMIILDSGYIPVFTVSTFDRWLGENLARFHDFLAVIIDQESCV